ncbi:MAG: glycosyltransferase [Candidatus Protochlamydia sp.]|nr:glycosyltransferase [Candidatus Protochlamydia sp.]
MALRILIVNNTLDHLAGTELYVLELAKHLIKLGHKPIAYSTELGTIAQLLRAEGIPVTDDLNTIGTAPDIIHGHHHLETLSALLHFNTVPAIHYCHGSLPWQESPLRFPRIYKYVAVCDLSAERLMVEGGVSSENISFILNFVDLQRFKPRKKSLPETPKRALVFSGFSNLERFVLIEKACRLCGIDEVHKVGGQIGKTHQKPEDLLGEYDLVFAKGRAALEALATGAAVISCDGAGSMVTTQNLSRQRIANFGLSERHYPYNVETIVEEIKQYNCQDAEEVSRWIRANSAKEGIIEEIIKLYYSAIEAHRKNKSNDIMLEQKAVSAYLRWVRTHLVKDILYHLPPKPGLLSAAKKSIKKLIKKII